MSSNTRQKKILKNIAIVLVSLLLCFILIEVGFRVVLPQPLWDKCHKNHPDFNMPMVESHQLLGWKMKANSSWCVYQPDTAEKITIETNSIGLRTPNEFTKEKSDNTFRVLVFGDSFVWGENLKYDQTFYAQLQKKLEKKLGKKVEVMPFGVSAYGTSQSYLYYAQVGKQYEADLVMYLFYQNDLTDSFKEDEDAYPTPLVLFKDAKLHIIPAEVVARDRRNVTGNLNYFKYYGNDDAKKPKQPTPLKKLFIGNSHFATYVDWVFSKQQRTKKEKDSETARLIKKVWTSDAALYDWVKKTDPQLFSYSKQLMQLIDLFSQEVTQNKTPFVLVNVPSEYQTREKYLSRIADDSNWENTINEHSRNYLLATLSQSRNIPYIDLMGVAFNEKRFFHVTDSHWSPVGARVSAQKVVDDLDKMQLLSK